jgi:hypothetical protein
MVLLLLAEDWQSGIAGTRPAHAAPIPTCNKVDLFGCSGPRRPELMKIE